MFFRSVKFDRFSAVDKPQSPIESTLGPAFSHDLAWNHVDEGRHELSLVRCRNPSRAPAFLVHRSVAHARKFEPMATEIPTSIARDSTSRRPLFAFLLPFRRNTFAARCYRQGTWSSN